MWKAGAIVYRDVEQRLFAAVIIGGQSFAAGLLGPVVLGALDFGRIAEAIRTGHPEFVFRRVRFICDQARYDRSEIAASAAGLLACCATLVANR